MKDDPATHDNGHGLAAVPAAGLAKVDQRADRGLVCSAFWNHDWFLVVLLVVVTFVAYAPVWRAGFIWDDDVMLTGNRFVQSTDGLRTIWFSTELPDYFPMTSTALWAEWRLWGANPLGYHLVNVFLHAFGAVLLWRVLVQLKIPGAWLAAAIFALHPVNVESVAWVSELKNTLAMVFFALTLLAYLRFDDTRRWRWYAAALGAFVLALLSKTAAAPLPLVLLGVAAWQRGRVTWRDLWRSVPFFAVAAALAVVTLWFHHHRAIGSTVIRTDDFWSRLAGAGWAIWFYFYKAVLPVNLVFIYPRWQISPANFLSYVPGLLVVIGLVIGWRFRRSWGRAGLSAFGYFIVMLLPVLGFLTISFMRYSFVADRWQYFAILGPVSLVAAGITAALAGFEKRMPFIKYALCGALLLVLGLLTWRQCGMYLNLETLWRTTLDRNPNCAVAETYLGNVLMRNGQEQEACAHYQKALAIDPCDELAHYNFGYALLQKGRTDEAIVHLQTAVTLQPDSVPAHFHLGNALFQQGRMNEAVVHFRNAVELAPEFDEALNRLGDVLLQHGQMDEAIIYFERALKIQPTYTNALNNLGVALFQKGRREEALAKFQKTLEIQPDFVEAHINLGKAFLQMGQAQNALPHFRTALTLLPNDPVLLSDLAWVLATWPEASVRNGAEALQLALKANRLSGGSDPVILRTLAAAYAAGGSFGEASAAARRALQLAESLSDANLAEELRAQLKTYEVGLSSRDGSKPEARSPHSP